MSSSSLSKVVLKSNTTMTLSDRFSEIMKMKTTKPTTVQAVRTGQAQLAQASAKNKRLAEQMSRRAGANQEPEAAATGNIKNRLGVSNASTKSRLGKVPNRGRSPGFTRGRGIVRGQNTNPRRGFSARGRNSQRGGSQRGRGMPQAGRRGGNARQMFSRGRGRGRGRGGRGGASGNKTTKEDLDSELDSYMNVGKKNDFSGEDWG